MTHKMVLIVPQEIYDPLANTAKRTGATPEELALEWLAAVGCHAARDPVENFIGALRSCVPDWADQHDKYLGQALSEQVRGDSRTGS